MTIEDSALREPEVVYALASSLMSPKDQEILNRVDTLELGMRAYQGLIGVTPIKTSFSPFLFYISSFLILKLCLFLQAAQHFRELDLWRVRQLKDSNATKKVGKAEVKELNAKVSGFKEALASKEKELADLKNSYLAKVDSFKEQITNFQNVADILRAAEDKAAKIEKMKEDHNSAISQSREVHTAEISRLTEDHATELSKLKDEHDLGLVDERTIGLNEALSEATNEIGAIKDRIFKGDY